MKQNQTDEIVDEVTHVAMEIGVDLSIYIKDVFFPEDALIFEDAAKSALVGAYRSAMVMIWISCAESIKRRFTDASRRDNEAGIIIGKINQLEKDKKSIDKTLIDKAKEYGLISDTEYCLLEHVYNSRCIYGHPYYDIPSKEQVIYAAAVVVKSVLSKPLQLKHGYTSRIINDLFSNTHYLDDREEAVSRYTVEMLSKIHPEVHLWLIEECFKRTEICADDYDLSRFFRRGVWIIRSIIEQELAGNSYDWHNTLLTYPKTVLEVVKDVSLYKVMGRKAQDSYISMLEDRSYNTRKYLAIVENIMEKGALSSRQKDRYLRIIDQMSISDILGSNVSIKTCITRVIKALKTKNWDIQNTAVIIIKGSKNLSSIGHNNMITLGRNILQAAEGNSWNAISLLQCWSKPGVRPLCKIVTGIALECFVNEKHEFRFKTTHIDYVLTIMGKMRDSQRMTVMQHLVRQINNSSVKFLFAPDCYDAVNIKLSHYSWTSDLTTAINYVRNKGMQIETPSHE